jgi:hypothetical protein
MTKKELAFLEEPRLVFGFDQKTEDPRDGLSLFGPCEAFSAYSIQAGVIGTETGIKLYGSFVDKLRKPILSDSISRPSFPGFEAIFKIDWPTSPALKIVISQEEIKKRVKRNLHERTFELVGLYLSEIKKAMQEEQQKVDIWFIVIPKNIWLKCRPKSSSGIGSVSRQGIVSFKAGQKYLFPGIDEDYQRLSEIYDMDADFHNQFKARALKEKINTPIQIILEPTLEFKDKYKGQEFKEKMKAHLAWTQSTTVYYKLGKLPWKLADIRRGVCYVGLVFKKCKSTASPSYACSAAQMFLDSGDGTVFKGNIGPWMSEDGKEYHLDKESAKELLLTALASYKEKRGDYPEELFIHGRAHFSEDEWAGFRGAVAEVGAKSRLVGVVIKRSDKLKIYNDCREKSRRFGNLRGLAFFVDDAECFLWTNGFIPRLNTSSSLEIPNPLRIQVDRGNADIRIVAEDILCLTKLNYNACIYGDGIPVTLRFSDMIGDILTAIDGIESKVKPFKFYI